MMTIDKNIVLHRPNNKPILADVFYTASKTKKPVIIFCHGYKGFKDWGAWNLMAEAFAGAGFFFIKFNFSHNGGTPEEPIDFPDLQAFAHNNYTKELDDLDFVINWISKHTAYNTKADIEQIHLMGHSRGGGIVLLQAESDQRIKTVISLAGVSDYGKRFAALGDLAQWKTDGVTYVINGRTKQKMPHFYQFYENFLANEARLNIQHAVSQLRIPLLIIHGNADQSVLIDEAYSLKRWKPDSTLKVIENANHVFGASHPWLKATMPEPLGTAINLVSTFIKTQV